jgi:uncharacterized protein YyaL (SSP411 family)
MPERLANHPSAFLRQQSGQTLRWWSWGDDALAHALANTLPILLSIGHAGCAGWQRMAQECSDDPGTAALMHQGFVNILVDGLQRPDLDAVYQQAHRLLRRGAAGGWPLTVFLSPQGLPFHSTADVPPEAGAGQPEWRSLLDTVQQVWRDKRAALAGQDRALLAALANSQPRPGGPALPALLAPARTLARQQLATALDACPDGRGGAPMPVHPDALAWLLQPGSNRDDAQPRQAALLHLRKMAESEVYDQIGGGFFRCGADAARKTSRFNTLLGENGLLLSLYAQALAQTGDALLRRVVEHSAGWALREMAAEAGGFHAIQSNDDRAGSGYAWQAEALRLALSPNEWDVCAAHWGLVDAPNVDGASWQLRLARPAAALASTLRRPEPLVEGLIATARAKLLAARAQRVPDLLPQRDAWVPTAATALMVTGLAHAGAACQRADWLQAARKALDFLRGTRWQDGTLQAGPGQDGVLDDHAFVLEATLALHAAAPCADDLGFAKSIADTLLDRFEDPVDGGFFVNHHGAAPLLHRPKIGIDATTPSGNGTAALALVALGRQLDDARCSAAAERCVHLFSADILRDPAGHPRLLRAAALLAGAAQ